MAKIIDAKGYLLIKRNKVSISSTKDPSKQVYRRINVYKYYLKLSVHAI